ncbi:MAG: NAD(P)-binding domain-containing protein [Bauldia sp.]
MIQPPIILVDADVARLADMSAVIEAIKGALLAKATGAFVAPPRHVVSFAGGGDLVFTVGGSERLGGFRAYVSKPSDGHAPDQLVAIWDMTSAAIQGVVLGEKLGAIRTGAIGGVAVDVMANMQATTVAVIGTGRQAATQLEAVACVRNVGEVRVFGRSADNLRAFASTMASRLGLAVDAAPSPREAVEGADVVVIATTSLSPVIRADWLKAGAHVNSVGLKGKVAHETGLDLAERADLIATDSPAQIAAYGDDFMLAGTPHMERVTDLADLLAGKVPGRADSDAVSLFYSIGLAGTEVVAAATIVAAARAANRAP